MSVLRRRATCSVICFSSAPPDACTPASAPPWPGSMAIVCSTDRDTFRSGGAAGSKVRALAPEAQPLFRWRPAASHLDGNARDAARIGRRESGVARTVVEDNEYRRRLIPRTEPVDEAAALAGKSDVERVGIDARNHAVAFARHPDRRRRRDLEGGASWRACGINPRGDARYATSPTIKRRDGRLRSTRVSRRGASARGRNSRGTSHRRPDRTGGDGSVTTRPLTDAIGWSAARTMVRPRYVTVMPPANVSSRTATWKSDATSSRAISS